VAYDKQRHPHTNEDISPLSFMTTRQGKHASTSQPKGFEKDTTDTGLTQWKRVWFLVCPPQTKK